VYDIGETEVLEEEKDNESTEKNEEEWNIEEIERIFEQVSNRVLEQDSLEFELLEVATHRNEQNDSSCEANDSKYDS
jgi:hypothetical protein